MSGTYTRARRIANHKYLARRRANGGRPLLRPALGTHRRIRGLMRMGHSGADIAEAADLNTSVRWTPVAKVLESRSVTVDTERRYLQAFETLRWLDGASEQTRLRAEAAGWPDAWQWVGVAVDDPAARPLRRNRPAGLPAWVPVALEAEHLRSFGVPLVDIARRLGKSRMYVTQCLAQLARDPSRAAQQKGRSA